MMLEQGAANQDLASTGVLCVALPQLVRLLAGQLLAFVSRVFIHSFYGYIEGKGHSN